MSNDQDLRDVLAIGELDLRAPLRTWRSRIEAVCAECFPVEDGSLIVGHLIRATINPQGRREKRRWARTAGRLLPSVWLDATGRAAVSRGILLALADRADAQQGLEV